MREEVKTIEVDRAEQGAMFTALNDLRNRRIAEGKTTETVDGLMRELHEAPTKKKRVKTGAPTEYRRDFVGRGGAAEQVSFNRDSGETSKRSTRRRGDAR